MNKLKQKCNHKETRKRTVSRDIIIGRKPVTVKCQETVCKNEDCGMVLKSVVVDEKGV